MIDFKQVVIPTNNSAADYEAAMQYKVMIFSALFFSRQESASEAKADFFAFAKEYMSGQDAKFNYSGALATSFFANQSTILSLTSQNRELVKSTVQHMLVTLEKMPEKSLFSVDHKGFQDDLLYQKLRKILMAILESSEQEADEELKTLCLRLILRWGIVRASAEDLLLAAQL